MDELYAAAQEARVMIEKMLHTQMIDEDCGDENCDECKYWRPWFALVVRLEKALKEKNT